MPVDLTPLTAFSTLGIGFGLVLLVQGMAGQRRAARIGDTATSTISSIAVGEVRISGVVEPAELTLTSPLQSETCVYYRARITESDGRWEHSVLDEERAVGFRVRDASGDVRVFPGSAQWAAPEQFNEQVGSLTERPLGLRLRTGGAFKSPAEDREAQIAALLTVQQPAKGPPQLPGIGGLMGVTLYGAVSCHYRESRIELGDVVTIVGMALPFDQLPDPTGADNVDGFDASGGIADSEVAADLAEAREAGMLETDPRAAWGNAAIPGFGIGHPTRAPELDAGAAALPLATEAQAKQTERTFEIAPDTLIVAGSPEAQLLISLGPPGVAVEREETRFLIGLLGAVLAIVSAVALATSLSGGIF